MSALIINNSSQRVPAKYLTNAVGYFIKSLVSRKIIDKKSIKELTIVFLNKEEAKKLNKQFRNKSYATDILSFESNDPESFGELILCSEVIKSQAIEHGLSFRDEAAYMILHGLLHLLGYEHEDDPKRAKIMFDIQDRIFAQFLDK